MQGNKTVIDQLNIVLGNELIGINQYFLHARMYKNFGFKELNEADYKVSIQKMKNADDLIERVLFLEGLPNLQDLGRLRIGEDCEEMLKANFDFEMATLGALKTAIAQCEQHQDYVSREVLEHILQHQEDQIDWLESQQYLIGHAGLANYLESMMGDD